MLFVVTIFKIIAGLLILTGRPVDQPAGQRIISEAVVLRPAVNWIKFCATISCTV